MRSFRSVRSALVSILGCLALVGFGLKCRVMDCLGTILLALEVLSREGCGL